MATLFVILSQDASDKHPFKCHYWHRKRADSYRRWKNPKFPSHERSGRQDSEIFDLISMISLIGIILYDYADTGADLNGQDRLEMVEQQGDQHQRLRPVPSFCLRESGPLAIHDYPGAPSAHRKGRFHG
jgi:hypothetical protein